MTKNQVLKQYIEHKKLRVKSEAKIKDIERDIDRFLKSSSKPLEDFTADELVSYLNSLGFKKRTMNGIKAYLKNFIKWKFEDYSTRFRNLDDICKSEKIEENDRAYEPEEMITKEEIKKLVDGETDLLYKNYWLILFYGGCRPSTTLALEWDKNIKFKEDEVIIKVKENKNKKTFYKSLPKIAEQYLIDWRKKNDSKWLFPSSKSDGHLHIKSAYGKLRRLSIKVLGKQVTLYCLRHSIATILYNSDDKEDGDVANQLSHTKNMKETYLNLDEDKKIANARKMYLKAPKLSKEKQTEFENKIKELQQQQSKQKETFHNELHKIFNKMGDYEKRMDAITKRRVNINEKRKIKEKGLLNQIKELQEQKEKDKITK